MSLLHMHKTKAQKYFFLLYPFKISTDLIALIISLPMNFLKMFRNCFSKLNWTWNKWPSGTSYCTPCKAPVENYFVQLRLKIFFLAIHIQNFNWSHGTYHFCTHKFLEYNSKFLLWIELALRIVLCPPYKAPFILLWWN